MINLKDPLCAPFHALVRRVSSSLQMFAATIVGIVVSESLVQHSTHAADNKTLAAQQSYKYKLGPLDKIRVKVFEWRPSRDEIFNWSPLNAEYMIGASGRVAFPLLGEISANGLTPAELAKSIGDRLQQRMGLAISPDTTIEVSEYRPFYIVGEVERPGAYPYRPGLTVLQAISISGGLRKRKQLDGLRLERESISSKGTLRLISRGIKVQLARKARLEAELKNAPRINFSTTLKSSTEITAQERRIFHARNEAYETQVNALDQLRQFLAKEVVSIIAQLKNHTRETALLKMELASVRALAKKGLTTTTRKLAMERNVMQLNSGRLRLDSRLSATKQEISRTGIVILDLQNKRRNDIVVELRKTRIKLRELEQQYNTEDRLLFETQFMAPRISSKKDHQSRDKLSMTVVRKTSSGSVQVVANELAFIQPDDTIKIEIPHQSGKLSQLFEFRKQTNQEMRRGNAPLRAGSGVVNQ